MKSRGKKTHDDSDNDENQDQSAKQDKLIVFTDKGKHKMDKTPKKVSCFLCNRPHWVFEFPKCRKLATLVVEEERQEEEKHTASISLLSAIQTKVGEQLGGCMCVGTEGSGKKL